MLRLASWLAAANLLQLLLGVARQGVLARWLGEAELGRLAYALALVALADALPVGAVQITVREAAARPGRDGAWLGTGLAVRLPQALLLAAGLALYPPAGLWAGLLLVARTLERFSTGALQAARRRAAQVVASVGTAALTLLAVLLVARGSGPDWRAGLAALAGAGMLGAVLPFSLARTGLGSALVATRPLIRTFIRASAPIWVAQLTVGLLYRLDVLMLRWLLPASEADLQIGWYQPAYSLIESGHLLLGAVVTAAFPVFASLRGAAREKLGAAWRLAVRAAALAGVAAMAVTWWFAEPVITLVFGPAFAPAAAALRWLSPALPLAACGSLTASLLTAVHRQADVTRVTVLLVAVNALGNLWAIPRFGYTGAAAVTALTEAVGGLALLRLSKPYWAVSRRGR